MGKCEKRAFQNGGAVSKADQLIAEMNAKYGVSGNAPAPTPAVQQPAPQPQPVQQPAPQQRGIGGLLGIIGGRQQQIDKAAGYANGGIIRGPGTAKSDSIPARVNETGEEIRVGNGERIVSEEQGAFLEGVAKADGYKSLDAMLEAGTGKPVGPTIKAGKRAAAGGLRLDNEPDEYAKAMQQQVLGRDAQGNGSSWSVGAGQKPTIGTMPVTSDRVSGSLPVANAPKESNPLTDGVKPWYAGSSTADNRTGLEMERSRRSEAASAGVLNDPVKSALQYGVVGQNGSASAPTPVANPLVSGVQQNYGNEGRSVPSPITKQNPGAVVDNQFTQGGRNYTVNPTSQEGISKVTAPGTSPLYTNIDPQKAVGGLNNQMIGQPADQESQGIARIANAKKIRGEMIANRDKDIPAGGYAPGIMADPADEANAKLDAMRRSSMVSNLSPSQQAEFNMNLARLAQQDRGQQLAADNARYAADVQERRAAGHDQTLATIEANKLAGNPLEQQAKQLDLKQKGIIAGLFEKANAGDKDALIKYNALTNGGKEPNYSNRYVTVQGGEETGPDGTTKIRRPSRVFDAQTGQWVNEGGQGATAPQQAPASAIDFLKKNPGQAEAFKAKYGYLPAGF